MSEEDLTPVDFRAGVDAQIQLYSHQLHREMLAHLTRFCPLCKGYVSGPRNGTMWREVMHDCLCNPAAREAEWFRQLEIIKSKRAEEEKAKELRLQLLAFLANGGEWKVVTPVGFDGYVPDDVRQTIQELARDEISRMMED